MKKLFMIMVIVLMSTTVAFALMKGKVITVGSETITVIERDDNNKILRASGTTVPTDATAGYSKGALFIDTDVVTGTRALYENKGTTSSCTFVLVGSIASGDITDGTIVNADISSTARIAISKFENLSTTQLIVGSSAHVPTRRTITGDVTISNTGVTAIGATKITTSMLALALQPSHVVKYGGFATWSGVGKTKKYAIVGALTTDIMQTTPKTAQTNERLVSAYVLKNNTAVFTLYTGEVNSKSWQYTIHRAP